jgi:hypothetical protein
MRESLNYEVCFKKKNSYGVSQKLFTLYGVNDYLPYCKSLSSFNESKIIDEKLK